MGEVKCYMCGKVVDSKDAFLVAVDCQERVYVCAKCYTSVSSTNNVSKDRVLRRKR